MHCANMVALMMPIPKVLGLGETISTVLLDCDSKPTCSIYPLSLNGPTHNIRLLSLNEPIWASLSSLVKLYIDVIDYYDKLLLHYVSYNKYEYNCDILLQLDLN